MSENCPKKFQMSEQYLDCLDKMSELNSAIAPKNVLIPPESVC